MPRFLNNIFVSLLCTTTIILFFVRTVYQDYDIEYRTVVIHVFWALFLPRVFKPPAFGGTVALFPSVESLQRLFNGTCTAKLTRYMIQVHNAFKGLYVDT